MTINYLPNLYDPAHTVAGPPKLRKAVSDFSRHDLLQLLCEAIEALDQLESYGADLQTMLGRWRRGTLGPLDSIFPVPVTELAEVWSGEPKRVVDEAGVPNGLPTVYAAEDYQWEEAGTAIRLDRLSMHDLRQALCQCAKTLELAGHHLQGLNRLVNDWQGGRLKPTSHFEVLGA